MRTRLPFPKASEAVLAHLFNAARDVVRDLTDDLRHTVPLGGLQPGGAHLRNALFRPAEFDPGFLVEYRSAARPGASLLRGVKSPSQNLRAEASSRLSFCGRWPVPATTILLLSV